jgi:hypothetical protein
VRHTKQTHAQYAAEKKTKSLKRERKAEQALGDMRPIAGVDGEMALRDLADVQRNGGKRQRLKTAKAEAAGLPTRAKAECKQTAKPKGN